MLVIFVEGKTGPMAWTSNGVSFPSINGNIPMPKLGEFWYAEICGKNPSGTVTFLKLIQKADNGVVIVSTPEDPKQVEWATRVAGEPITTHVITKHDEEGNPVPVKILSLWDHAGLKERFNNNNKKAVKEAVIDEVVKSAPAKKSRVSKA